jgi:hypothetical protein
VLFLFLTAQWKVSRHYSCVENESSLLKHAIAALSEEEKSLKFLPYVANSRHSSRKIE